MTEEVVVSAGVADGYRVVARVLPFDDEGRLLMISRVTQDATYVVSIGGGVEDGETVAETAVRECFEEAGATITLRGLVLVVLDPPPDSSVQYFYAAELQSLNPTQRTGAEFSRTDRGSYDLIRVCSDSPDLEMVQPPALRELLRQDWRLVRLRNHD